MPVLPSFLYVAIGGALGACLRYATLLCVDRLTLFPLPYATLCVNVLGSFLMGLTATYLMQTANPISSLHPFIIVGVLGGYTTFSSFSLDLWQFWNDGQMMHLLLYGMGSVILSFIAMVAGMACIRGVLS